MPNKKAIIWKAVGCVALVFVLWLVVSVRLSVLRVIEAEKQGTAYQAFFVAVDKYTEENGRLPESFENLLSPQSVLRQWDTVWQELPEYMQELIEPDFAITPNADNLSAFVPGYEAKAKWAESDCEIAWKRIVENCVQAP